MITLKTLETANAQEVFDQVAAHLLKQNAQSKLNNRCRYRGENGMKCAIGCLMSDSEYNQEWEGINVYILSCQGMVSFNHRKLLRELQWVHDEFKPEEWPKELERVAKEFDLEFRS